MVSMVHLLRYLSIVLSSASIHAASVHEISWIDHLD